MPLDLRGAGEHGAPLGHRAMAQRRSGRHGQVLVEPAFEAPQAARLTVFLPELLAETLAAHFLRANFQAKLKLARDMETFDLSCSGL